MLNTLNNSKEEDTKDKEEMKDEKEDDTNENETKEKVSAMGGGIIFSFYSNTLTMIPHFLFIILRMKGMNLPFTAKGRPRLMGEMKEGNFLFSFYSIFKYVPCISPISFLLSYK